MAVFSNRATLKYNGKTITSNTVYGNMPNSVRMTKDHIESDYVSHSTITYIINIINISETDLTDASLVDDLGAYTLCDETVVPLAYTDGTLLFYLNGVLQATPTLTSDGALTLTGLSIPEGAVATIIYQTTVDVLTPVSITNTVTLSGNGLPSEISVSDTIPIGLNTAKRSLTYSVTNIPCTDSNAKNKPKV